MTDNPEFVEDYIAQQLWRIRAEQQKSLEAVAWYLGLDEEQIEQYEKGQQEISTTRLFDLSIFYGVNISYFFPQR